VHRRVDRPNANPLPVDESVDEAPAAVRSIMLGSEELGIVGKLDLLELDGDVVVPVDYKKGHVPDVPERAHLPERVQVCAQGLLLRANGFACDHAVLRRNAGSVEPEVLDELRELSEQALLAPRVEELYGIEGMAARRYFERFGRMLKAEALAEGFDLEGRNRRPPKDPVNALLSLSYAFLVREVTTVLEGIGLDAWVGFLHRPRPGKPALALDLMEEFRPVLADSVVIGVLNNGTLTRDDFDIGRLGTTLRKGGRKAFIRAFERRMAQEATHPTFSTRMSYRRILEVQARLLCKTVLEEISAYPSYRIR